MEKFSYFVLARSLHVMGVVFWIGGVAFVTTVLIPSLKRTTNKVDRLNLFEQLEGKFSFQAKISTITTGITGLYMIIFLDAWNRYLQIHYWWLHLMTVIWLIFTIVLFVLEPLFLQRWFRKQAVKDSENAFAWLQRLHIILLTLSMLAILGAVAGSHGFNF